MSAPIISIKNLGKRYILGTGGTERYRALRDVIANTYKRFWEKQRTHYNPQHFWALRNIDFNIQEGETLGIIGRNGAGKTTLLKLLSQITDPTEGEIHLRGRVASLLEVGTGFHPELTGRENIFMNGSILGMTKAEIEKKFDEIVAFSEIEKFLDTPVKRYSSGMYVRLAFAVAAHLESEILLIDEVLAVGDIKFQKKCIEKTEKFSSAGHTVLFVSHNMSTVRSLCKKCIWLDGGRLKKFGDADEVIESYLSEGEHFDAQKTWPDAFALSIGPLKLRSVSVRDAFGNLTTNFKTSEPIFLSTEFEVFEDCDIVNTGYHVFRRGGLLFTAGDSEYLQHERVKYNKGLHKTVCVIPADLFNYGEHSVEAFISGQGGTIKTGEIIFLRIFNDHTAEWSGEVRPKVEWKIDPEEKGVLC